MARPPRMEAATTTDAKELFEKHKTPLMDMNLLLVAEHYTNAQIAEQWTRTSTDGTPETLPNTIGKRINRTLKRYCADEKKDLLTYRTQFDQRRSANTGRSYGRSTTTQKTAVSLPDNPSFEQLKDSTYFKKTGFTWPLEFSVKLYRTLSCLTRKEAVQKLELAGYAYGSADHAYRRIKREAIDENGNERDFKAAEVQRIQASAQVKSTDDETHAGDTTDVASPKKNEQTETERDQEDISMLRAPKPKGFMRSQLKKLNYLLSEYPERVCILASLIFAFIEPDGIDQEFLKAKAGAEVLWTTLEDEVRKLDDDEVKYAGSCIAADIDAWLDTEDSMESFFHAMTFPLVELASELDITLT